MESLGGLLFPLLILLLFIPIFLSGRKQRRQMGEMQRLQSSLEVGDSVTTTSGLRGTVVDVSYEDTVDLEIADDVVTTWMRAAVRDKVADTATAPGHRRPRPRGGPARARRRSPTRTSTARPCTPTRCTPTPFAPTPFAPPRPPPRHRRARPADTPSDANGTPRP